MSGRVSQVGIVPLASLPRPPMGLDVTSYLTSLVRIIEQNQQMLPAIMSFLNVFSKHVFIYKNGDMGFLFNAIYDIEADEFYRVDTTKPSFWLDVRLSERIPGEATDLRGFIFWQASGDQTPANPIGPVAAANGWLMDFAITTDGTLVTRGTGFEVDRNASAPFVRAAGTVHVTAGVTTRSWGLASNWFNDLSEVDTSLVESWFAGFLNDQFVIKRAPAGVVDFYSASNVTIFAINSDGSANVVGPFGVASYLVSTLPNATVYNQHIVYVENDVSGRTIAFSDGSVWKRPAAVVEVTVA